MTDLQAQTVFLRTRLSLLDRVRNRSSRAWSEFYDTYWRVIHAYAVRHGVRSTDAEDVLQEVMIKLYRALPAFRYDPRQGRFLSWIQTVTRNTVNDYFRRVTARAEGHLVDLPDGTPAALEEIPAAEPSAAPDPWQEEWERSTLRTAMERVARHIRPTTMQAFERYALRNEPAEDVARALGVTRNTVFIAKNRVLKLLADEVHRIKQGAE